MLFNSYIFVFLFFPVSLIGYWLCVRMAKKKDRSFLPSLFLVIASLLFYSYLKPAYLPVLLISLLVNFIFYRQIEKRKEKKALLAAGVLLDLLVLGGFKYTGSSFVPLGISFFTFSQIAFLVEGCRGSLKHTGFLDYSVYLTFFPKIMEGPIALPADFLPEYGESRKRGFSSENLYRGLTLFILGLSKKVLLADTLGKAVDFGYTNLSALNTPDALIVMLSYTLQLYFDFSGYCDMAMGIARCFSILLPLNFDMPYRAENIMDFWKRWHITLTRFFTKYLYIPLGGNRKGRIRTYINTLVVFLVSGIWHGAGLTFVVWGGMHGVLYVITRWLHDRKKDRAAAKGNAGQTRTAVGDQNTAAAEGTAGKANILSRAGKLGSTVFTFLFVNAAWVFFRAPSIEEALTLFKRMGSFTFTRVNWNLAGNFNLDEFWYVIKVLHLDSWQYAHYILMVLILTAALFLSLKKESAVRMAEKIKPGAVTTLLLAILLLWCVLSFGGVSSFIYLNF